MLKRKIDENIDNEEELAFENMRLARLLRLKTFPDKSDRIAHLLSENERLQREISKVHRGYNLSFFFFFFFVGWLVGCC